MVANLWKNSQCLKSAMHTVSSEETLKAGKIVSSKYYDKSVEKLQTPKSLLLFTEMDASLVGAPDFKPECTALTLS